MKKVLVAYFSRTGKTEAMANYIAEGLRITGGITSAVRTLHRGTRRLAEGDLSAAIEVPNEDEFGDLADSFNEMTAAVRIGRSTALALAREGARQAENIQGQTQYLLDIAVIAPMVGLLGTVLGIIGTFQKMAVEGTSIEAVGDKVGYLFDRGWIEVEAVTYIRGRSLPKLFILIDEAQNLSPHEVKTIVSRAGRDSKVVLAGDPFQIDNPYLDASSNGLSTLVEAFKEQPLFGHIWLDRSERSDLASLAAELL